MNALKKSLGLGAIYVGLRKTANIVKDVAQANIDMIETNNLFEVSMGKVVDQYGNLDEEASKYYTKAMNFQNEMNEKLATNKSELQQYQAMYYSMFKGQGIDKNNSYTMSESLTKAGYDIASLYNLSVEDAMNKIKSGIAGQVESLRTIGIDVSESALTKVIRNAGIDDRSVQQLSYAEKEVARYIAILNQAGQAQGDFAKTFESPANQIRVFKNQLIELKQVAGSFIVNAFGGIIVWANAIIMAIKEIIKSIASLFGYDLSSGGSTNLADNIGISDIDSGLGSATKKAKELKKQLMGFDEINNIDPASKSGSGSGGVATGIDDKLLKSLKEWDNKMNSITGKVQEYRDAILKALGFTKDINGKLKWSWKDMNNILKVLTIIAGIVGGILIIGKITKLVNWLKTLFTVLKTGKGATTTFGLGLQTIGKIILGLKSGFTNLGSWIFMVIGQYKIFRTQGNGVISSLKLTRTALAETGQGFLSLIPTWAKVGVGLAGLVGSSTLAYNSMKDLEEGSISTTEGILKLSGSMAGATASGALLGSVFGPIGTAIGAVTGFVISGISALAGYNAESLELTKKIKEATKEYDEFTQKINENAKAQLSEVDNTETLAKELDTLVDKNGKIKKGYEARVSFILNELNNAYGTEAKVVDGTIQKYDEFKNKIFDLIDAKKAEIVLSAYEEKYKNALEKRAEAYTNLEKAEKEYVDVKEKCNSRISELEVLRDSAQEAHSYAMVSAYNIEIDRMKNMVSEKETQYNKQKQLLDSYNQDIYNYETLQTATVTDNKELQKKAIEEFTNTVEVNGQKITLSGEQQIGMLKSQSQEYINIIKNKGDKVSEEEKNMLNGVLTLLGDKLKEQTQTVEDLTPDNIEAWKTLAEGSEEKYNEYISDIPEDAKLVLDTINGKVDTTSEEQIKKWGDLASNSEDKYDKALSLIPEDARKNIQSAVNEINRKQGEAGTAGGNVGSNASSSFDRNLGSSESSAKNFLLGFTRVLASGGLAGPVGIFSSISTLTGKIIAKFNKGLGNASPSKKTRKSALFFAQGFTNQIKKSSLEMISQAGNLATDLTNNFSDNIGIVDTMKELNQGIKVNTKDMAIDTTQYVNYGAISGQIQAQSKVSMGNISDQIYNAVINGMERVRVQVDINAKTDEGVIVEKASEGFRDIVNRTGELPFPVPV